MSARQRFLDVFPALQAELLDYLRAENMPQEAVEWYEKSLAHNTPGGKLNRGLSVVDTLDILLCTDAEGKRTRDLTEQEYKDAAVLGWCVELLQAYFLVADDMMDASLTRRGQPCWYKMPGVGNIAINDAFMLEAAIYHLLKTHFRSKPYYGLLIELFHETTFQTELGQLVDLITAPEDDVDLNRFSLKKHSLIVIYKTAFYSFYLPVALAMRMANITDESLYKRALDILLPLGEYFQVQDDYLDCYGSPEVIGKIGTDIQDNKCGWLINVALTKATAEQRSVLDAHYGQRSAESEAKVKEIFKQIDVEALFKTYEKESFDRISAMIAALPQNVGAAADGSGGLKREVFTSFLEKVYKRTK